LLSASIKKRLAWPYVWSQAVKRGQYSWLPAFHHSRLLVFIQAWNAIPITIPRFWLGPSAMPLFIRASWFVAFPRIIPFILHLFVISHSDDDETRSNTCLSYWCVITTTSCCGGHIGVHGVIAHSNAISTFIFFPWNFISNIFQYSPNFWKFVMYGSLERESRHLSIITSKFYRLIFFVNI
jgi:hypothetical protein